MYRHTMMKQDQKQTRVSILAKNKEGDNYKQLSEQARDSR